MWHTAMILFASANMQSALADMHQSISRKSSQCVFHHFSAVLSLYVFNKNQA